MSLSVIDGFMSITCRKISSLKKLKYFGRFASTRNLKSCGRDIMLQDGFICNLFCECKTGENICLFKQWIRLENIIKAFTSSKVFKNGRHCNAHTPYYRFAIANIRIAGDSACLGFSHMILGNVLYKFTNFETIPTCNLSGFHKLPTIISLQIICMKSGIG